MLTKTEALALVSAGYMSLRAYIERFEKREATVVSLSEWFKSRKRPQTKSEAR